MLALAELFEDLEDGLTVPVVGEPKVVVVGIVELVINVDSSAESEVDTELDLPEFSERLIEEKI